VCVSECECECEWSSSRVAGLEWIQHSHRQHSRHVCLVSFLFLLIVSAFRVFWLVPPAFSLHFEFIFIFCFLFFFVFILFFFFKNYFCAWLFVPVPSCPNIIMVPLFSSSFFLFSSLWNPGKTNKQKKKTTCCWTSRINWFFVFKKWLRDLMQSMDPLQSRFLWLIYCFSCSWFYLFWILHSLFQGNDLASLVERVEAVSESLTKKLGGSSSSFSSTSTSSLSGSGLYFFISLFFKKKKRFQPLTFSHLASMMIQSFVELIEGPLQDYVNLSQKIDPKVHQQVLFSKFFKLISN